MQRPPGALTQRELHTLHAPATVVRFAIESNLDAYPTRAGSGGRLGRQALAKALHLQPSGLSERMKSRAQLAGLANEVEGLGLAERGTVSRLAGQVQLLPTDSWSVNADWWPILRDGYKLDGEPRFNRAFEVLLAAEAFAAAHPLLLKRPPNRPDSSTQITERDLSACRLLIDELCWLASGPFGVAYQSQRLISYLAPVSPETVTAFIRSGVITTQVIRALDRSLRRCTWNWVMRDQYSNLLATPPPKIFRRTNWMRALRRLRLLDYAESSRAVEVPKRDWLTKQLFIALKGEQSYSGARATDRRYALWCLTELEHDPIEWAAIRTVADGDTELSALLSVGELMRQEIVRSGLANTDAFQFTPPGGWALLPENVVWSELLDEYGPGNRKGLERWRWASSGVRNQARAFMQEALFNPDVIKQRSSTDALGSAGPEMRESVAFTINNYLAVLLEKPGVPLYLIERSLAVLGMMGRESSKDVIQRSLTQLRDECLVQAVASAGDISYRHPIAAPWLMATVMEVVRQRLHDEDVVIAGITALVAARRDPQQSVAELRDLPSPSIQAALRWAERVDADRVRFEQSEVDSYPVSHQP